MRAPRPYTVLDAARPAFWNEALPGQRVLVWYEDDTCWHERALVWPAGRLGTKMWTVATPDFKTGGIYVDDLSGSGDVTTVQGLALDGSRPFLPDDIYAFAEPLSQEELIDLMKQGKRLSADYVVSAGGSIDPTTEFIEWNTGAKRPLPDELRPARRAGRSGKGSRPSALPLLNVSGEDKKLPEGTWVLALPSPGLSVGDKVKFDAKNDFAVLGNYVLLRMDEGPSEGHVLVLERLEDRSLEAFRAAMKKIMIDEFGLQDFKLPAESHASGSKDKVPAEDDADDARTLSVTRNKRGRRRKLFCDAVDELEEDFFKDWPLEDGLRSVLHILERMSRDGLAPVAWTEAYLGRKRYADQNRSQFELRALAKVFEDGILYDQLNVASLASFEHAARRFQLIIGAHKMDPLNPSYVGTEHYGTTEDGDDIVAPGVKSKVLQGMKDQAKTFEVHQKQKELKIKLPRAKGEPKGGKEGAA